MEDVNQARTIAKVLRAELRSVERRIDRLQRLSARLDDVLGTDTADDSEDTANEHHGKTLELELV